MYADLTPKAALDPSGVRRVPSRWVGRTTAYAINQEEVQEFYPAVEQRLSAAKGGRDGSVGDNG